LEEWLMRDALWKVMSVLVLAGLVAAAGQPPARAAADPEDGSSYLDRLPPLIDRDILFGDPEISGAQISPDGERVSFRKPYRDVMNIWVKGVDEPFDAAKPVTADTERPVRGYFWSQDGRYVLYVQDKGGNENFHVYAVDPDAKPEESTGVPPARDLTPLENVRAMIYAVPEQTPGQIVIGLNERDPSVHDVYRLDLETGEKKLLIRNESNVAGWVADLAGNVRVAYRQTEDAGSQMLRVEDGELGEAIYSCSFEETCSPLRFHKNGKQLYIESNKGVGIDLTRLMLLDVKTGETELVESDPESDVDFGRPIFSDATEELIGTAYVGDRVRIYPRDEQFARDLEVLREKLPDGELGWTSMTEDMSKALIAVSRDVNPGSVYLYERDGGKVTKLYDSRPELPSEHLAHMEAIRYPARDGARIPAYLTRPRGITGQPVPTLLLVHGGPWARDTWGYDPFAQFLANRGYAVLQPNFRGSTGYGKAFLNAGNEEWGTGRMQHDLTDAVKYLIGHDIALEDEVGIMGGSYGGYATLAGLAFTPDLYACGVDIVGPSNIITLLESIPPYWGPIKKIFDVRVGDLDDPEDRERLKEQSPLFSAEQIEAPLLIIQGANDPRVKKAESDQIVVALRELDREVDYMVAPDEGHGFAREVNRLAMFAEVEKFLAEHLGGRHQKAMQPEVAERLEEITVDVSTVTMPERAEGADEAAKAPLPEPMLERVREGKRSYRTMLELGGRELEVETQVTVTKEEGDGGPMWKVTAESSSPMGSSEATYRLDGETLVPRSLEAEQGPATVQAAFTEAEISGEIKAQGRTIPIDVSLEAPVFAGDTGLDVTLPALGLEPGETTTLRTFDLMSQKVRTWKVTASGPETIEVPAGSFETVELVVEPLDGEGGGGTRWVTADAPSVVVRSEETLPPRMGGGTAVAELTALGEK
jgi:dipeptidyl aminopeptidase/acylaminoacyl peptidase